MDMMQSLKNMFGYNVPILLNEIDILGISEANIRQVVKRLVDKGYLERFGQGVYYIPKLTLIGKSLLSAKKVFEKKYIYNGSKVYGFYAGLTFENAIGITNQMSNVVEIVTNNESSRVREVLIGNQKVRLRKSSVIVTDQNARILQFLDFMNRINLKDMSEASKGCLITFVKNQNFNRDEVFFYISKYPSRTSKNLIESGVINEIT